MKVKERLAWNKDKTKIVPYGDKEAANLFAIPGQEISDELAEEHGLLSEEEIVEVEKKVVEGKIDPKMLERIVKKIIAKIIEKIIDSRIEEIVERIVREQFFFDFDKHICKRKVVEEKPRPKVKVTVDKDETVEDDVKKKEEKASGVGGGKKKQHEVKQVSKPANKSISNTENK